MTTTPTTTDRVSVVALIGATVALLAVILLLAATVIGLMTPTTHAASPRPACVGDVVVLAADASPCDVTSPQRLDVVGYSRRECAHFGGWFRVVDRRCFDVDY